MSTDRRPYRREPEEARREALIEAALELVAVGGPQAATVRAIAARAGVTPGLVRVSLGIEHIDDIQEDFAQALAAALVEAQEDAPREEV